jgi:3-hydroxyacyl-CoA dehydrogenase
MASAVAVAGEDPAIRAIVIRGGGRLFSGGADISEFDNLAIARPWLPDLIDIIEASAKPVVAAIHGSALGGGLEVALACHYRLATPGSMVGVPEVKLGVIPGAGGTQRLPRLVGVSAALRMIVTGDPVSAEAAFQMGLVDQLVDESDLISEAIRYARSVSAVRRSGDRVVTEQPGEVDKFIADNPGSIVGLEAPLAAIDAVRAAISLPLSAGQQRERGLFMTLMKGEQSKALRHVFFAERAASRIKGIPSGVRPRLVSRVGIIGAGPMGRGIAISMLSAGLSATLFDADADALIEGCSFVAQYFDEAVNGGHVSKEHAAHAKAHFCSSPTLSGLSDCNLLVEAVFEDLNEKTQVIAQLDDLVSSDAILATNTSSLDIGRIAAATSRPSEFVGLHFFSPAHRMKLVEVVRGPDTSDEVLVSIIDITRRIGKVPVLVQSRHGFIGNRMLQKRQSEAMKLLLEGASPEQIDLVHTQFGMPLGPFQMLDLAGVDIGWHRDPTRRETIVDALCAAGRRGLKTGAGFYDYDKEHGPAIADVTWTIIEEFRARATTTPREISDEEIIARTLYIMVNEAARILQEGVVQRASDIDVVWLHGYGWPRWRGGPLWWAQSVGLQTIVDSLQSHAPVLGPDFSLSQLLESTAARGGSLYEVAA